MSDEIAYTTIRALSARYRKRELSPVEVTRTLLGRIEQLDPTLHAFVTLTADPALDDAHTAEAADVLCDPAIERFGDALPIFGGLKAAFVGGVTDEGDFGQDGRHVCADQDHEGCFFHSAIAQTGASGSKPAVQGALNVRSELAGLFDLLFERDFFHQVLQFVN